MLPQLKVRRAASVCDRDWLGAVARERNDAVLKNASPLNQRVTLNELSWCRLRDTGRRSGSSPGQGRPTGDTLSELEVDQLVWKKKLDRNKGKHFAQRRSCSFKLRCWGLFSATTTFHFNWDEAVLFQEVKDTRTQGQKTWSPLRLGRRGDNEGYIIPRLNAIRRE